MNDSTHIAIFASGSGSNAEKIFEHFLTHQSISVSALLCNNPSAFALKRAEKYNIATNVFDREAFYESGSVEDFLDQKKISFIVLAGFLWLVPGSLIEKYQGRLVNIHPALLPKYGGKGMYGMKVHEAVYQNHESETGITIHQVNPKYDEGHIIFQAKCPVLAADTPETIAQKVHQLEHRYYPKVIEDFIKKIN